MEQNYEAWEAGLASVVQTIRGLGGRIVNDRRGPTASSAEIVDLEADLGIRLPSSFRKSLLEFAGSLEIWWELDEGSVPAELPFARNGGLRHAELRVGGLSWDFRMLPTLMGLKAEQYQDLDRGCGWPEDRNLWESTVPFMLNQIDGQPEFVGCRADEAHQGEVVFLDYNGEWDSDTGFLADDFGDFVARSIRLLCTAPRSALYSRMMPPDRVGLDPTSENAALWLKWLGVGR